jgi:hypothetical protein
MYLRKAVIKNIKCFTHLEIEFLNREGEANMWTTLFGRNGLGKSTLLQAIGIALAGPAAVRELLPVAENWVRAGEPYGEITAEFMWTEGDALAAISAAGRPKTKSPYIAKYIVTGNDPEQLPESLPDHFHFSVPTIVPWSGEGTPKQRGDITKDTKRLQLTAYAEGKDGWLACGYGPFRRLSGGGQEADRILYAGRISARFITLFREDAALTNTTDWLIRLHNTAREGDHSNERALQRIKQAFAENLLPEQTELIVDARSVSLKIGVQEAIPLRDLSDGYRSMLALGIDLLRWLIKAFPDADDPMKCHGVVLIDELDAHLHPAWQRQIGHWLRTKFPNVQFIVATHSPFLAQVADVDKFGMLVGGDYPELSSNIVLEQTAYGVQARQNLEPVTDLRADQILMTPLFDMESLYSPATEERLERHQELYLKRHSGKQLSEDEESVFEQLSLWRSDLDMLSSPALRDLERELRQTIEGHSTELLQIE